MVAPWLDQSLGIDVSPTPQRTASFIPSQQVWDARRAEAAAAEQADADARAKQNADTMASVAADQRRIQGIPTEAPPVNPMTPPAGPVSTITPASPGVRERFKPIGFAADVYKDAGQAPKPAPTFAPQRAYPAPVQSVSPVSTGYDRTAPTADKIAAVKSIADKIDQSKAVESAVHNTPDKKLEHLKSAPSLEDVVSGKGTVGEQIGSSLVNMIGTFMKGAAGGIGGYYSRKGIGVSGRQAYGQGQQIAMQDMAKDSDVERAAQIKRQNDPQMQAAYAEAKGVWDTIKDPDQKTADGFKQILNKTIADNYSVKNMKNFSPAAMYALGYITKEQYDMMVADQARVRAAGAMRPPTDTSGTSSTITIPGKTRRDASVSITSKNQQSDFAPRNRPAKSSGGGSTL